MTKTMWLGAVVMASLVGCAVDDAESVETTEQAATTDVWHATWNGASADASFYNGFGGGYVSAFEYKSASSRSAYLNLSTWQVDPNSQVCETIDWGWGPWTYCYYTRSTYTYGYGEIPSADAKLNPGNARVRTTLPASFGGYQCTWDWYTYTGSCSALTGGTVDVSWKKNNYFSSFNSGTTQVSYGYYTYKSQGTWRSTSADASGSVLGLDFVNGYGTFGDTKSTNVTKSIIPTTKP